MFRPPDSAPMIRSDNAMWLIFQGLIVFAVVSANIHWQITPNPVLPAAWGFMLAYGLTWLLIRAGELWRGLQARREDRRVREQQRLQEMELLRRDRIGGGTLHSEW